MPVNRDPAISRYRREKEMVDVGTFTLHGYVPVAPLGLMGAWCV